MIIYLPESLKTISNGNISDMEGKSFVRYGDKYQVHFICDMQYKEQYEGLMKLTNTEEGHKELLDLREEVKELREFKEKIREVKKAWEVL